VPHCSLRLGTRVLSLNARQVTLDDGTCFGAGLVIDARGPGVPPEGGSGFQKFVGWEVELDHDWPETEPVLMDATVPQEEGYRFFYTLPFTSRRVLIEDTVFSDSPELDIEKLRRQLRDWIRNQTPANYRVAREEYGVLPMPWSGPVPAPSAGAVLAAGAAGGWYHPATGYSLPLAVRLALALAQPSVEAMVRGAVDLAKTIASRYRFSQFLNALLFCFVAPEHRWQLFRRLYRALPEERLSRFYAMTFTSIDSARMILGWPPPVAPLRALRRWLGVAPNPLAEGRQTCSPPSSPIH
jgi:lycopene beta-cyclase